MKKLAIIYVKGEGNKEIFKMPKYLDWTAPQGAQKGDIVLYYLGGPGYQKLYGIGKFIEDAYRERPAPWWTKSKFAYFARSSDIVLFERPVSLYQIREAYPKWKRWEKLYGVRVHYVPKEYVGSLAKWLVKENPEAKKHLIGFINKGGKIPKFTEVNDEWRYEGSVVTKSHKTFERKRANRDLVLRKSNPYATCIACGFNFRDAYGGDAEGFIEVHHLKPFGTGTLRKPNEKDFAVLCSNCHSIVHWRQGKKPLTIRQLNDRWKKGEYKKFHVS